jgi:hypothetical protein
LLAEPAPPFLDLFADFDIMLLCVVELDLPEPQLFLQEMVLPKQLQE